MDLANLISHPGPDPVIKSRPYSPPTFSSPQYNKSHDKTSYFSAAPTYYSRPPLSPPVEDQPKCSLPSISTLFEGADSAAIHHPASMFPFPPHVKPT